MGKIDLKSNCQFTVPEVYLAIKDNNSFVSSLFENFPSTSTCTCNLIRSRKTFTLQNLNERIIQIELYHMICYKEKKPKFHFLKDFSENSL